MILGSILKKTVQILANNPVARKKAGDLAVKAYKSAKPVIDETRKNIEKSLKNNFKK
jgi:hypothetical protein|tara:strand:+ start:199 stop:369 length:171 start_codon:yes stop_codon:yes gene_type:complete